MGDTLWKDVAVFHQMPAKNVDALGALPHQEIAGSEHDAVRLLLFGLDRNKAHARPLGGFTDRLCIGGIVLLPLDERRWAEERTEALPAIVKELIGSGATILVTAGTPATLAATRTNATIPIVLVGVDDPVSLGLVDTLMRPGGNVTGLSLSSSEVIAERLELLRQLVPGLHRLAVIVRDDPGLPKGRHFLTV